MVAKDSLRSQPRPDLESLRDASVRLSRPGARAGSVDGLVSLNFYPAAQPSHSAGVGNLHTRPVPGGPVSPGFIPMMTGNQLYMKQSMMAPGYAGQPPFFPYQAMSGPQPAGCSSDLSTEPASSLAAEEEARQPKLKYSHKIAERRRRKEMNDTFEELKGALPIRNGKMSKWEVLTMASEHIVHLSGVKKQLLLERERLHRELGLPLTELIQSYDT